MKIILSRKSMDSENGGIPSPVIMAKEGYQKFYPLPIPFAPSDIKYEHINLFENFNIFKFINDVKPNYFHDKKILETCHLDPDIRESSLKRTTNWKKAFGQVNQAQSHLHNENVDVGDVFLFFGWFQFAEYINLNGELKFKYIDKDKREFKHGFHAIYGYLQIGEKLSVKDAVIPHEHWLSEHPHVRYKNEQKFKSKSKNNKESNNTVYVANDYLKINGENSKISGAAYFKFSEELILTQNGQDNRTVWQLPNFLHPDTGVELSYNKKFNKKGEDKRNWFLNKGKAILKSAAKGQEFVFTKDPNGEIADWAIKLIKSFNVID